MHRSHALHSIRWLLRRVAPRCYFHLGDLELPPGERNFHIFYYLMAGASPEEPATSRRQSYVRDASRITLACSTLSGGSSLLFPPWRPQVAFRRAKFPHLLLPDGRRILAAISALACHEQTSKLCS